MLDDVDKQYYTLYINQGEQKKGSKFLNVYTEKYDKDHVDLVHKLGMSNQGAMVLVVGDDVDSLMTSYINAYAANFNTSVHHYLLCEPYEFRRCHKLLREEKAVESAVRIFNFRRNELENILSTTYDDSELDSIFVDTCVTSSDTSFLELLLPTLWLKLKTHGVLVYKNSNDDVKNTVGRFFTQLRYGIKIQISMCCGYLVVKKPVAVKRENA